MTIRARLIAVIAATQTLFLIVMILATLEISHQAARHRIQVQADHKAALAALVLREAVSEGDAGTIRDLARSLVGQEAIDRVTVFDRGGAVLATAAASGPAPNRITRGRQEIRAGDTVLGAVAVQVSGDFLEAILAQVNRTLVFVASVLVLLSGIASWLFGNVMTRRLTALRTSAQAVAQGDFERRMPEAGPAEVVAVARAMNAMAERLGALYAGIQGDLETRKRLLESTFEHMSQGVAIFDSHGYLVEANNAFPALIGLPAAAVAPGIHLDSLVDIHAEAGAYASGAESGLEALCRRQDWSGPSFTFNLPFPDGRTVAVQRTRLPEGGFIAIHEDVTRRLEDERRLLHAAKLTTLGRLATATAHELNQPLNVIRLSADNAAARMAAGTATPEYLAEKLRRICVQTERAARIIDHMRIFGRKPTDAPVTFDLGEAVRSAAEFFVETARLHRLQVELSVGSELTVHGHPALIEQVIANILSNAFAALIRADVASPMARVSVARRQDRIRVEIADNGGGIPADVLPHIFEPFFTTKTDREGTGLGLSISYGIVADMGGRLEVENREGGATFSFELEAVQSSARTASVAVKGSEPYWKADAAIRVTNQNGRPSTVHP